MKATESTYSKTKMKYFKINRRITIILTAIQMCACAREPPMVELPNQGTIMGIYRTLLRTRRIAAFYGIPYALPPIGERRFQPPEIFGLPKWDGVINATLKAPDCLQSDPKGSQFRHDELFHRILDAQRDEEPERGFSEDCLYLNVYSPEGFTTSDNMAVMVWFHGGEFVRGSPHDLDPFQIVFKQKVIVVTASYRLNIFGFFTTLDPEAPGNYGLMDQTAVLEWVQNNIQVFGGNKDNVCLFGQGSGAVSVGLHLTSEYSVGLFHKAIMMSGNILASDTVKTPKKEMINIDKIPIYFSCFRKPTKALLSCLRRVPAQALLDIGEPLSDWKPVIDNNLSNTTRPFIIDDPMNMIEKGLFQRLPILTGFTNMEGALLLSKEDANDEGINRSDYDAMRNMIVSADIDNDNDTCADNQYHIFDAVEFFYNPVPPTTNETVLRKLLLDFYTDKLYGSTTYKMAEAIGNDAPVYIYRFDLKPISEAANVDIPTWIGVPHNFDLTFVFGLPYMAQPEDYGKWESSDKRISDIVMKLWTNFAIYSNPTNSGVYINWEPFTSENPGFLIVDRNFNMSNSMNVDYKAYGFWNEFYPKVLEIGTKCCNDTESSAIIYMANLHILILVFIVQIVNIL